VKTLFLRIGIALIFIAALASNARAANCPNVGYRVLTLPSGLKTAIWYPTTDAESAFEYQPGLSGSVALNGAISNCSQVPLVIFSHGLYGCGLQSVFYTEELARQGYVVAAPDHEDALVCSVDGTGSFNFSLIADSFDTLTAFLFPWSWTDQTYIDRKNDVETLIDYLLSSADFAPGIDASRIGISGHSLGGYTALGVAGGWPSWKDKRIGAALAFSPYGSPFSVDNTLKDIEVPVMYQGAPLDILTPNLLGSNGAYALSNDPKYLAILNSGTHVIWTNLVCAGYSTIASCLQKVADAQAIDNYGIDFFNQYLLGSSESLLSGNGTGLSLYEYTGSAAPIIHRPRFWW
jgi:predicted dienelactone hydrolase